MGRNYCAIDFETACHDQASACAVGVARIRDGAVVETFFSLIQPPKGMAILLVHHEALSDAVACARIFLRASHV